MGSNYLDWQVPNNSYIPKVCSGSFAHWYQSVIVIKSARLKVIPFSGATVLVLIILLIRLSDLSTNNFCFTSLCNY
jgi:hypothetical protein